MKISPAWIREFVSPAANDNQVAEELTSTGTAIEGTEGQGADLVWEAEVTTNRVDAMNHYGVAREVSAIYDLDLRPVAPVLPASQPASDFRIEIADAQGCARYVGRIIRGVKCAPSPEPIVHRLELIGQRSISNVADATNYVLNEIGQPTHAFDLDKLEGGKIVVRRATEGEMLKTLDGVERKLSREDLVIADGVKAVALAGIMGGFDTMITAETRNVLIESAWFDPATIRRTSRRLGMHTDASHRFERGADCAQQALACARVAELVVQLAGGVVEQEIDCVARRLERPTLRLRREQVRRILGIEIPEQDIARILRRLGFGVTPGRPAATVGSGGAAVAESAAEFAVEVPAWRLDVEREIDLIEEVGRIYGYLKLPNTLPAFAGAVVPLPHAEKRALLRARLLALGYSESISPTFLPEAEAREFSRGTPVPLENPVSEEAACLRSSLVPGLVTQLSYNLNRGNTDVMLFEAGDIFELAGDRVDERPSLAFAATGTTGIAGLESQAQPYGFYDMKGDVESLLAAFGQRSLYFDQHVPAYFHPGRAARAVIDGETVARFGQLHPDWSARRKLRQEAYVAEVFVDRLFRHALREPSYRAQPRFPAVERDFSFRFPDGVSFAGIRQAVDALGIEVLQELRPLEILRGAPAGQDKAPAGGPGGYGILMRVRFQSAERTLRDDEVAGWSQAIVKALEALGGSLRA